MKPLFFLGVFNIFENQQHHEKDIQKTGLWSISGAIWCTLDALGSFGRHFGRLEPNLSQLGAFRDVLNPTWSIMRPTWANMEPTWDNMKPTWADLEATWCQHVGVTISDPPTGFRADPVGRGRGGVNPSPGTGDLGVCYLNTASTRHEAQGLGGWQEVQFTEMDVVSWLFEPL